MATATRARRTRAEAPTVQNVTTRRGGKVHRLHPVTDTPFPACRTGNQTRLPTSRYVATEAAVNCEKCLATAPLPPRAPAAERTPTGDPYRGKKAPRATLAQRRNNGIREAEAAVQAAEIIAAETAKVVAQRDQPTDQRKPGCSDEDYALAERVRTLRASGAAWWKIAYEMELPGSGVSAKQGKTGAAHARRLWERAWGPTYKDTTVERDTKARKTERALTQPGRPYFAHDALDLEVLDAVKGKPIEWTTRLGAGDTVVCSIQNAIVSGLHRSEIVQGPKGRVLKFYELPEEGSHISGPLRSVYVDRIEKVGL
jgi:hypothetical protein